MRTITIGFSKSKKRWAVYSWFIKWFDESEFSHVFMSWKNKFGKDIIYQASGNQVNFIGNRRFILNNEVVHEFDFKISDDSFDSFVNFAIDESGAPYSLSQAIGILLKEIFLLKSNPLHNDQSSYICSELISRIMIDHLRLIKEDTVDYDCILPSDVYNLCLRIKNKEVNNDIPQN